MKNIKEIYYVPDTSKNISLAESISGLSLKELADKYQNESKKVKLDDCIGVRTLSEVEKDYILAVIKKCEGHKSKASSLLGISRSTLDRKLIQYRNETNHTEKKTE